MSIPIKHTRVKRMVAITVNAPRATPKQAGQPCPCGFKHLGDVANDVVEQARRKMEERNAKK